MMGPGMFNGMIPMLLLLGAILGAVMTLGGWWLIAWLATHLVWR